MGGGWQEGLRGWLEGAVGGDPQYRTGPCRAVPNRTVPNASNTTQYIPQHTVVKQYRTVPILNSHVSEVTEWHRTTLGREVKLVQIKEYSSTTSSSGSCRSNRADRARTSHVLWKQVDEFSKFKNNLALVPLADTCA